MNALWIRTNVTWEDNQSKVTQPHHSQDGYAPNNFPPESFLIENSGMEEKVSKYVYLVELIIQ
jgi:hypothetical protein